MIFTKDYLLKCFLWVTSHLEVLHVSRVSLIICTSKEWDMYTFGNSCENSGKFFRLALYLVNPLAHGISVRGRMAYQLGIGKE